VSWRDLLDPWTAGLLAGLVALVLRSIALHRASVDRAAIGDPELLARMTAPVGIGRRIAAALLLAAGVGLTAAAVAAGGFREEASRSEGARFETVLVLDASNSMLAEDVAPSRLRLEQALARHMVGQLAGRIGVVYFAGSGYVLSPLTDDRAATLMFTESVHPTNVGRGGTSIVDGLEQALVVLAGGRSSAVRSVVVFSDGESTVDETALDVALERARRAGIPIHAIGVGTAEGGQIPLPRDRGGQIRLETTPSPDSIAPGTDTGPDAARRWLRDQAGRVVVTRLDEASLRHISGATGGLYAAGPRAAEALLARMPAGGARAPVSTAALNGLLLAAFLCLALEAYVVRRA
jgi:Ca-activated chloride channel family protein